MSNASPGSDVYEYHEPADRERLRFRSRRSTLWLRADELALLSRRRRGRETVSGAVDVESKAGETGESMTNAGGVTVNGTVVCDGPGTGERRSSGDAEIADGEGEVDASRSCALVDGVRRVAGLFGFGVFCEAIFLTGGGEGGPAATLARKAALTALEIVVSSVKLDLWRRRPVAQSAQTLRKAMSGSEEMARPPAKRHAVCSGCKPPNGLSLR